MEKENKEMTQKTEDEINTKYMRLTLAEAQKAFLREDVPVGCVIVSNGKIIGKGYNKKEAKHCSLYHAELVAIKKACKSARDWRLCDATMFVTMEPCAMCAGAIVNHRIKKVVIGTREPNFGACGSGIDILNNSSLNTKTEVVSGVLEDECRKILQDFFENRRKINKCKKNEK